MKLRKVFDLCKKRKVIILYDKDDIQYLSDGYGVYPLLGLPEFTQNTIINLLEISPDEAEKYYIKEESFPEYIDTSNNVSNEYLAEQIFFPFVLNGKTIKTFTYSNCHMAFFADSKNLEPFNTDYTMYIRGVENDMPYICVKKGLLFAGAINITNNIVDCNFRNELYLLNSKVGYMYNTSAGEFLT